MKKNALISTVILIAIMLGGCQRIENSLPDNSSATIADTGTSTTSPKAEDVETTTPPQPENPTVELFTAGDNLIHSSIYEQAQSRSESGGYDFDYAYENIAPIIPKHGVKILNQETLICNGEYPPSSYPCFNSPPELGDKMIELGFNVFSMANNHVLDKGRGGLQAALDYWDSKTDVVVCGAYRNDEDMQNIRTLGIDGIVFSFLGFTEHTNGIKLWTDTDYKITYTSETEVMKQLIEKADEVSDVVVVNVHWGVENSNTVTDSQRFLAKKFADWGADVIIGTHPHTIQSMEYIDKDDGSQAFVLYSLGNFISAQSKLNLMVGMVASMDITLDLESGEITISDVQATPIITHYTGSYKNIRNYPYYEYTAQLASQHGINGMSKGYIDGLVKDVIPEEFLCPKSQEWSKT